MKYLMLLIPFVFYLVGMIFSSNIRPVPDSNIIEPLFKGIGTVSLAFIVLFLHGGSIPTPLVISFFIAILLTAVGDVSLAYRKYTSGSLADLLFMVGLGSFLLGYLGYSISLLSWKFSFALSPLYLIGLFVFAAVGFLQFRAFAQSGLTGALVIPVALYLVQATLLLSLVFFVPTFSPLVSSIFFIVGAVMIYLSDSFIGYNMFVSPLPNGGEYYIFSTYIVGQLSITTYLMSMN